VADAEEIANSSNARLIANWEIATWFEKRGVKNTSPMNTGGTVITSFGKVSMTAAQHSSSLPDGSYGGNPNGFIVACAEERFYYSGDTDVFGDMHLIGKRYQPQFAFLPIGDHFTMDVFGACEAAQMLGVTKVIGMHFDTFPPIRIDHEKAKQLFAEKGIELLLMKIGETIQL
jgi:L-ascorbate metabolism protein UlaG (beta-lactamase superfamily)